MNTELSVALVTGAAALLGVIVGAITQHYLTTSLLRFRQQRAVLGIAAAVANLRGVFRELSDPKVVSTTWALRIRMPALAIDHISALVTIALEHEPALALPLVWVQQAARNFDSCLQAAWCRRDETRNELDRLVAVALDRAAVESRAGTRFANEVLLRAHSALSWRTRFSLARENEFATFWKEVASSLKEPRRTLAKLHLHTPAMSTGLGVGFPESSDSRGGGPLR